MPPTSAAPPAGGPPAHAPGAGIPPYAEPPTVAGRPPHGSGGAPTAAAALRQAHTDRGWAGGAAGSILSGGLGDLLKQFQQNGHSETANSWVSPGPNKQISPNDLAGALGADQINALTSQTGLSRDELLSGLSQHLPEVINHLTPDGRLPTENEIASRL